MKFVNSVLVVQGVVAVLEGVLWNWVSDVLSNGFLCTGYLCTLSCVFFTLCCVLL